LLLSITGLQLANEVHKAFGPVFGLENVHGRDNDLSGSSPNHNIRVFECLKDRRLDERSNLGCGPEDQASIVLEQVACDGSDASLLLC